MEAHFSREIEEESEESLFQKSLSLKKKRGAARKEGHKSQGREGTHPKEYSQH